MMRTKRIIALIIIMTLTLGSVSFGQVSDVMPGLIGDVTMKAGEYEYEEVTFISGKPILLKGIAKIPDMPKDKDTFTYSTDYTLANTDEQATLARKVTYQVTKVKNDVVKQTVYKAVITKIDETIVVGSNTYTLAKFFYSDSRIIDNTPAVDYFNGSIDMNKTYYVNGTYQTNEGVIDYEISTESLVGYDQYWGANDTRVLSHKITADFPNTVNDWTGLITVKMVSTKRINFEYNRTDPQNISFYGNYMKITKEENLLDYDYDLPDLSTSDRTKRNKGSASIRNDVVMDITSLVIPKLKDIGGHWAENEIALLGALEIVELDSQIFSPDTKVSRLDFTKMLVKAMTDLPQPTQTEIVRRSRTGFVPVFADIPVDHPDYHYIEYAKTSGLSIGENAEFKPDRILNRAECITMIVRALGLENKAPSPPYKTMFVDDANIQEWAKDYIYVASEIGIVSGYEGHIYSKTEITRAEAVALIDKYIDHIRSNITYDYREKILSKY